MSAERIGRAAVDAYLTRLETAAQTLEGDVSVEREGDTLVLKGPGVARRRTREAALIGLARSAAS